ncbi:hypothetical protein BJY01DRAFT_9648 [Aspergillus pseudoustus]|uniref:F-box domain-containing protein n=1 Tax=Aspergillus pseudoustus TaxID=1810923 RepID=A0ABR4JR50_9EURO
MSIASLSGGGGAMQRKSFPDKERSIYDNDLFVSPISERTPSWSGTRWTRFFPELSSHFTLISPVSTHSNNLHHNNNSSSSNNHNNNRRGSSSFNSFASHSSSDSRRHTRHSSSDSEDTESKTGPSSLWSDELADDAASSCYSRRSSVTSLGSEISASAYKSPGAFSIISPARAGVFDDSVSVSVYHRSGSAMSLSKRSPAAEPRSREKPLPCEPPIQMAPLSIRRKKKQQPETIREDTFDNPILESPAHTQGGSNHPPTLSQAAEDLENALAGLVEHKVEEAMPRIDAPLQVRRGNMDIIATRAAPIPPLEVRKSSSTIKVGKASPDEEVRHAKKPHKARSSPFSFRVPGFGKKHHLRPHRPQFRSLSSSSVTVGLERRVAHQEAVASKGTEENNGPSSTPGFLSPPLPVQRPASVSSERELRLKLPRLQTKEVRSSGMLFTKPTKPVAVPPEIVQPVPKPRKTFSFEPEGTMSENLSQPVGLYSELEMDSGPTVIYELDAGPGQQVKVPVPAPTPFVPSGEMPGSLPDKVVYSILRHCSSLQDLFNFAVMNRQFYRVFKLHELDLIQSTVFAMSPPAWELREMSPPWDCEWQTLLDLDAPVPEYTASLYLDRYTRDLYTLVRLKSLILARCGTFLRPETIRGLAGLDDARASEIDNAFWRIWSFCRIFGCGKGREGDVVGQLDWLDGGVMAKNQHTSVTMSITEPFGMNNVLFEPPEGFGLGNHGGLSQSQLYDMTEIWTCLGVLLQPIHGKCAEARRAGIFKGHDIPEKEAAKEEAVLEEWTSYILTLGPSAILALGSIATVDNPDEIFQRAQSMGLTKWEHDPSRSFFFREAVSKAYKPRQNPPHKSQPLSQSTSNSSRSSRSSNGSPTSSIIGKPHRRRQAAYAAQLRNRRIQNQAEIAYAEERPISSYAEIMNRLAGNPPNPQYSSYRPPLPHPPPCPSIPPPPPPATSSTTVHQPPNNHTHARNIQCHTKNQAHNISTPYYHSNTQQQQMSQHQRPYMAPVQPLHPHPAQPQPQIRDPADAAIDMMVRELGFAEEDAKWALKITDSGEGINPNAAVSLLIQEYQRQNPDGYLVPAHAHAQQQQRQPPHRNGGSATSRNSILESVLSSREAAGSGWRWA